MSPSKQEIVQQYSISAAADTVFNALVHRLTGGMTAGPDMSMQLVLEQKPGGRWYRDLGQDAGHLWATVQSIKPGVLLELTGPLWMSGSVNNHLIIRFHEENGSTTVSFKHTAWGFLEPSFLEGTEGGWKEIFDDVRQSTEGLSRA